MTCQFMKDLTVNEHCPCPAMETYLKNQHAVLDHPLIQSFLQENPHRQLLAEYACHSSSEAKEALDRAFHSFLSSIRLLQYVSKTIRWEAVQFDKKQRRYTDKHVYHDGGNDYEESFLSHTAVKEDLSLEAQVAEREVHLEKKIENKELYEGLSFLTPRQIEVLQLLYDKGLTTKEAAACLHITQQGVSKINRQALTKLKSCLERNSYERPV
ncbi:sigma-70 family RNA polymerase sigma factor [Sinobaca sp. H24]|uniref:sigma-70 family RNA polymerase sigma factor n=1 Tax=Sinobaca sp. H24 TaxID=2923376 RepID=UPI00207934CA|nr:sigma-70 family RNA polymerase sigma factor [Sinobaca sp. H24]